MLSDKYAIRKVTLPDLPKILEWRNHPEIRRYMYTQREIGLEEHQVWFAKVSQDPDYHLLIYQEDGQDLGFINIHKLNQGGIADWGFYARPDAPKGTGTRLGKAALEYAFKKAQLHKLCGQALGFNERSMQLHRKLGFLQEGFFKEHFFDGQIYQDIIHFGLLAKDWPAKP